MRGVVDSAGEADSLFFLLRLAPDFSVQPAVAAAAVAAAAVAAAAVAAAAVAVAEAAEVGLVMLEFGIRFFFAEGNLAAGP